MAATEGPAPGPDLSATRVLHVVQKFSSGVGTAIAQYTRSLPEVEHHLLSGTAVDAEGDLADQAAFTSTAVMSGGHGARVRQVRRAVRELQPDVVHAHSSHAGVYTRLAVSSRREFVVYTPHCYAFERRDVGPLTRGAFRAAEGLLAGNTSAFAACSAREEALSAWWTSRAARFLVPNIGPPASGVPRTPSPEPLVVGGGRLSPQKDPAFFLAALRRLREARPGLRALWLGDDDPSLGLPPVRARLEAEDVEVSGWQPRSSTLEALARASVYLHSARWEGFPLMVAEAVALGVPTLVRRVPSFAGVPAELTVRGPEDVGAALGCLGDPAAAAVNVARWNGVLESHTAAGQRAALIAVYTHASRARRSHQ